jgi:AraC-like DNA-binding protein
VRNTSVETVDGLDRPVLAIGNDYAPGTVLEEHHHRRAQFLYGASGLMEVGTDDGAWVVPPNCGVWIPARKPHRVRMVGVSTRSLYIAPQAAPRPGARCEVLLVSPLLQALLLEAVDIPALYAPQGRDAALMRLALHELARAPALPFFAPLPRDAALHALCVAFLHAPHMATLAAAWAARLHQSERSFTRFFRAQTGMAFGQWRQHACLVAALARLSAGQAVTAVALDLGYESPGAFSTMFKRRLGFKPSEVARQTAVPGPPGTAAAHRWMHR